MFKDSQFLSEDGRYGRRLLGMVWVSILVHLAVFTLGVLIAPTVRVEREPPLPPLFGEEGATSESPSQPVQNLSGRREPGHRFGLPPRIKPMPQAPSFSNAKSRPLVRLLAVSHPMLELWGLDRGLAWLIEEIVWWIEAFEAFLDRLFSCLLL